MMRFADLRTDDAVLAEIGQRLGRQRLSRNLSQSELAELAGVGRATVQRLEQGETVQMSSMIKLLRALGMLDALDSAVAEPLPSPISELERDRKPPRLRASRRSAEESNRSAGEPWSWGEQPGGSK